MLFVKKKDNLITKLDDNSTNKSLVRSYTWGLDASGSMQGAGGVGGLLMVNAGSGGVHFPAYDLNGNVMGLVNATNGNISAKYEYGPFGEVFCSVGDMAKVNPFGFSTKYTDSETDLVYYGYRYYSPALGRWINRDPIEEKGGLNLYAFVNNAPVNKWDRLGLLFDGGVVCTCGNVYYGSYCPICQAPRGLRQWLDDYSMFRRWKRGQFEAIDFGPGTPQSKEMSESIIGEKLRKYTINKFKDSYCSDWWAGVDNFSGSFSPFTAALEIVNNNATASYVGSATGSAETLSVKCPEGKVTVEFKFTNVTSLKSYYFMCCTRNIM